MHPIHLRHLLIARLSCVSWLILAQSVGRSVSRGTETEASQSVPVEETHGQGQEIREHGMGFEFRAEREQEEKAAWGE